MFVLDQNHSELTERHTRKRFRPRGGLSKRSDVERLSSDCHSQPPQGRRRPRFSSHLNLSKNNATEDARDPKQHDGAGFGASHLLFREVLDKAAATTAPSMDLI